MTHMDHVPHVVHASCFSSWPFRYSWLFHKSNGLHLARKEKNSLTSWLRTLQDVCWKLTHHIHFTALEMYGNVVSSSRIDMTVTIWARQTVWVCCEKVLCICVGLIAAHDLVDVFICMAALWFLNQWQIPVWSSTCEITSNLECVDHMEMNTDNVWDFENKNKTKMSGILCKHVTLFDVFMSLIQLKLIDNLLNWNCPTLFVFTHNKKMKTTKLFQQYMNIVFLWRQDYASRLQ